MNKFEELQLELSKYTYRPGWTFELIPVAYQVGWVGHDRIAVPDTLAIQITALVPSVDPPHRLIPIEFTMALSAIDYFEGNPKEYLAHALKAAIWRLEQHEFDEWFKYNGVCVTDPHPERKQNAQVRPNDSDSLHQ